MYSGRLLRPEILYEQSIRTDLDFPIVSYIFLYKTYTNIDNCITCYEKASTNYENIDMFVYSVRIISPAYWHVLRRLTRKAG